ncbi:hypothetical protein PHYBLDRAFT_175911 [Phycomyces blakesleeanus NRRL 1555(-)]|uniref:Retrotransposon gag domain-containing protein n=1 Tax=Phycomyces blakesleeanus (strain ATCC 8743b / DSM 1359 / FGSC 10004 / NBRC 33097 / NRRL 1555) TaxID=763407 RepID=A0A167JCU6_PHYB8|nr:hypothetical protein PHYBLDRAFT_175911 [Phycomyces blakesleeanus NRRL 1555(-)]OAD65738.1 hypothetical protein PHYBLDRAFT_175911 [Phycomyces blakesleeanus NRRL 1555(-)]|eukprot:XP_018283778.1 hypothetical protein PHYBLDRAFT_175911 [Phycomyces blakesleeanus NRRL 1555(-)]
MSDQTSPPSPSSSNSYAHNAHNADNSYNTTTLKDQAVVDPSDTNANSDQIDVIAIATELDTSRKNASTELLKVLENPYSSPDELNEAQKLVDSTKARWVAFLAAKKTLDDMNGETALQMLTAKKNTDDYRSNPDSFVPPNLPVLQLKGGSIRQPDKKIYDSIRSFLNDFEVQLIAHSLPLDKNWERLFRLTCDDMQRLSFERTNAGKGLTWKEIREKLELEYGYPQYVWAKRFALKSITQRHDESVKEFSERYRGAAHAADLHNEDELVWLFISSLVKPVRDIALQAIVRQFGLKMPHDMKEVIQLIINSVEGESANLFLNKYTTSSKRRQHEEHRPTGSSKKYRGDPRSTRGNSNSKDMRQTHPKGRHMREGFVQMQNLMDKDNIFLSNVAKQPSLCRHCRKVPFFPGHHCPEFPQHKPRSNLTLINPNPNPNPNPSPNPKPNNETTENTVNSRRI